MVTGNWLPIETAPKDGKPVLMYQDGGFMTIVYWNGHHWDDGNYNSDYEDGDFNYWQGLPEPPTEGEAR